MGAQPLYGVRATLRDAAGTVCDQREFSIGLRTVDIDRSPLAEGSRFCVRVNGRRGVLPRGKHRPARCHPGAHLRRQVRGLVTEARDAHVNMMRINGCSIYEARAFYAACDRAGILVWQDFMFTATKYPATDREFYERVRDEIEQVIPLLRHHPSLALWCGDNETVWFFADWNSDPAQPVNTLGSKFCSDLFPDLCRALDPRRPYWISSPSGGEYPNSELSGDCHWWLPAFMNPDMHRRDPARGLR